MNAPTEPVIKKLFALSSNQCAFPACGCRLFGPTGEMVGEICHIKARSPKGPRDDPALPDRERHAFENLILLCRNHHKVVDDDPRKYTVEWLKGIKQQHEMKGSIELSQRDARLARALLESYLKDYQAESNRTVINQTANGERVTQHVTQVAGNYYANPPKQKNLITPPPGSVSNAELGQIDLWIADLAEKTAGMPRDVAFGMWRNRFKNRFGLRRSEQLLSAQLPLAEAWYRQQLPILKRGLKTKAPDAWRKERYTAIHAAMNAMGVEKLTYYAQAATRLKMKKPFTSLTKLTKVDLDRVYTMVLRDARGG
jgi:hypothetical protein